MSENSTPEERTELPTPKRMGEYRKQGQLHVSPEVSSVSALFSGFLALSYGSSWMFGSMQEYIQSTYRSFSKTEPLTETSVYQLTLHTLSIFGPQVLFVALIVAVTAILAVFLQTDWNVKEKKVEFRWSFLNPVAGLQKIFSIQGIVRTLKSVFKLAIILPIGYFALKGHATGMINLVHMQISSVMAFTAAAIKDLFWQIMYVLIAFAIFDYFWSRYMWFRQNKMTKDEVKDERKALEGDEATKRKIQAKGLQRIMERIRTSVPQADVVITNPTHFAVAIKYDRSTMKAPKVIAKGKGFLALRIRQMAKDAGVPVLERKPLARALYAATEVGSEIPYDLFKAVAEVLAYVYRLKGKTLTAAGG